ncbi:DUF4232 domain-containing protein [Streptomyces sp. NPDC048514]|uniref:DUF4232 domain-containing protein n=1 Tax=Streptomyces sp. NPDC048514 TaxID=3365564 RepID=UPI003714670E
MRTGRTSLLAATGVALAALALTACDNGTGTKDEGASPVSASSAGPSSGSTAKPAADRGAGSTGSTNTSGTANTTGTTGTSGTAGTSGAKNASVSGGSGGDSASSKGSGSGGTAKASGSSSDQGGSFVLCNGSNTAVSTKQVARPLNHMLLTVTNTGSRTCRLTYYPILRFDEMQWVPQAAEETRPQAVTSLAPGESGYAGVLLSAADGSGSGGMTGHKLTVGFQGRTPNSGGGPTAIPALPAKGVYYDSSLEVTYWQQNAADALNW